MVTAKAKRRQKAFLILGCFLSTIRCGRDDLLEFSMRETAPESSARVVPSQIEVSME